MKERKSPWAFTTCLTLLASCASLCTLRIKTKSACFRADCLSLVLRQGKHRGLVFGEFRSDWTSPGLDKVLTQRNFQTSISSPWQLQNRHMVKLKEKRVKKSAVKEGLSDEEMACRQHCLLHKPHDPNSNPKSPQKFIKKEKIIFTN